jgi:predicted dehydrogenase
MKKFKVAMIGCGGVSWMHFDAFQAHPERVELVAACDPNAENLKKAQEKYKFPNAFGSLDEMISKADWEVGVVCTPTSIREKVVTTLANAGKHSFIEKPFADNIAEATRMLSVCQKNKVKIAVDQNFRYFFPFYIAKDLIKEGRIGRPISVILYNIFRRKDEGWRMDLPRHALSVMGVHWFDGFRWILNSEADSLLASTHSNPAIESKGDTDSTIFITFKNGTTVSYTQSFSSMLNVTEARIIGEKGTLFMDYKTVSLYTEKGNKPAQVWDNPYTGPGKAESAFKCLNELLNAIENGSEAANSGEDNIHTIRLLDSAYESAATKAIIKL